LLALVLGTSVVFWVVAFGPDRLGGIALCFSAMVQTSLLGALITFSQSLWFPVFGSHAFLFGLTPLEDQQLAGLIMWVPMNALYIAIALALTGSWLRAQIGSVQRRAM
jgi:putative membrane protein